MSSVLPLSCKLLLIFIFGSVVFFMIGNRDKWYNAQIIETYTVVKHSSHDSIIDLRIRNFQYFDKISSWTNSQAPWFVTGGSEYPKPANRSAKLLPEQAHGDRILEQLMFIPKDYTADTSNKLIVSYESLLGWAGDFGKDMIGYDFKECPVSKCILIDDTNKTSCADAIIYKRKFIDPGVPRPKNQVWIMLNLESPKHFPWVVFPSGINWTATYRRDSDISIPYGKWVYYNPQIRQKSQNINYAANKTKKVAWFVSNCNAQNNRLSYANQLAKFIPVDIYGKCGPLSCPRTEQGCFEALAEYKFYLSFENSNCQDYITEKLFGNAYSYNVLPIVMGTNSKNYRELTPEGSFIHVDDFSSPDALAAYLHKLDQDDDLYNSYFKWKGTGEFINHYFWCRLCAMLHANLPHKNYQEGDDWWKGPGICR